MQYVSYCRRSSDTEQQRKYSLDTQYADIEQFVSQHKGEIIASFNEVRTGTDTQRPELKKAIEECERTGAALIVSKLSRLSRDIGQVDQLFRSSLKIVIVEFGIECGYEQVIMLGAVNALFVQQLKKNIKRGIKTARERGVVWRKITPEQTAAGTLAAQKKAKQRRDQIGPILHGLRMQGFSYQMMADILNKQGLQTVQGRKWTTHTSRKMYLKWSSHD